MSKNEHKLGNQSVINVAFGVLVLFLTMCGFLLLFAVLISKESIPYSEENYLLISAFVSGIFGCTAYRLKNGKSKIFPGCLAVIFVSILLRLVITLFSSPGQILSWDYIKFSLTMVLASVIVGSVNKKKRRRR